MLKAKVALLDEVLAGSARQRQQRLDQPERRARLGRDRHQHAHRGLDDVLLQRLDGQARQPVDAAQRPAQVVRDAAIEGLQPQDDFLQFARAVVLHS